MINKNDMVDAIKIKNYMYDKDAISNKTYYDELI